MTTRARGVVGPKGAAAVWLAPDPDTSLSFDVQPWRVMGGRVNDRPLRLRMAIEAGTESQWIARAPSGAVVEFELDALVEGEGVPQPMVWLYGTVEDAELSSLAANAPPPPQFYDAMLGALVFDPRLDKFAGEADWCGRKVQIGLSCYRDHDASSALAVARQLWPDQDRWHAVNGDVILRDLLRLKNDVWSEPDEAEVTAEQFLERIALESIDFHPDGELLFFYDDGDLFFGHTIIVAGTLDGGIEDASLAG